MRVGKNAPVLVNSASQGLTAVRVGRVIFSGRHFAKIDELDAIDMVSEYLLLLLLLKSFNTISKLVN
jgi:hypothetical protein